MKKIKTIIKNNILGFIVGAILFGGLSVVYAATLIDSGKVSFSNDNMKSTNVQDAIDELNTTCVNAKIANRGINDSIVTTGDGLYADSTETGRYVYKGANPNNYITLDSGTYRIISVESDGTLKIIKNSSIGDMAFDAEGDRYYNNVDYYCNSQYGCNVWGSMDTTLDSSGNNVTKMPINVGGTLLDLPDSEASLNTYLNNDWYNSLDSSDQNIIVSHMFNVGAVDHDEKNLKNTVTQEQTYKWNGKVGLMNVSDYVKASSNSNCTSVYAYLDSSSCYSKSNINWITESFENDVTYLWTIAPESGVDSSIVIDMIVMLGNYKGHISDATAMSYDHGYGVAPVFYLSSNITLSGSGTSSDPYVPSL